MEGHRGRRRIIILGSGNVASSLAPALDAVADVVQVYSRDIDHARALAATLREASPITSFADIDLSADIAIIAVADDAVAEIGRALEGFEGIVAHTSGSVPMEALSPATRRGVFYPLQTFSRSRRIDFKGVSLFIEGDSEATTDELTALATEVSTKVFKADSQVRAALHVPAVFACNFANYMWDVADNLLKPGGFDIRVFEPLLEETLRKALTLGPHQAQTGPAMRLDFNVIRDHVSKLPPDLAELYTTLTNQIIHSHFKNSDYEQN